VIRWFGEKMGWLQPPDEEGNQVRAEAHKTAIEARVEVNESRKVRGVPTLEYDLLTRASRRHR